jgi:hypothetical protein
MKRLGLALGIALLIASAPTVAAAGRPVDQFNDHFEETFPDDPTTTDDDLCGIPVTTHADGVQNGRIRPGHGCRADRVRGHDRLR